MVMGVRKTYQTIGLFFAIFTVAYSGSLFKQFTDKQDRNEYHKSAQVVAQVTQETSAAFMPVVQASLVAEVPGINDEHLNTTTQSINKNRQTRQEQYSEYALKRPAGQAKKPAKHALSSGADKAVTKNNSPVYSRPDIVAVNTGFKDTNLVSNTAFIKNTTSLTSDTSFLEEQSNIRDISSKTTSNLAPDSYVPNTTKNTDNTNATSSDSINTEASAPQNKANHIEDNLVENQWATANCPYSLPDGSTKITAKQYQQSYGCRYLETCRALNDGSKGYRCLWQFYSSN